MRSRRFATLLLGVWVGAELWTLASVIAVLHSVDALLASADRAAIELIRAAGPSAAALLDYNVAGQVRSLLWGWGWAQLALAVTLFGFLLLGTQERRGVIGISVVMLLAAIAERFMAPSYSEIDRILQLGIPNAGAAPLIAAAAIVELLKWVAGLILMFQMMSHREQARSMKRHVEPEDEVFPRDSQ